MQYRVISRFRHNGNRYEKDQVFQSENLDEQSLKQLVSSSNIEAIEDVVSTDEISTQTSENVPDGFPLKQDSQEADQTTPPLEETPPAETVPESPAENPTEAEIQKDLENLEGSSETPSGDQKINIQ